MRYICFDLGDRRTGVALGDSGTRVATPVTVVEVPLDAAGGKALLDALARVTAEQVATPAPGATSRPDAEIVLGLPLNMDGTEGPRARLTRAFGARLGARTGLPVRFADERLSSADADWALARSGLTHGQKRRRRDALAAAAILRGFLAALPAGPGAVPPDPPSDPPV